MNKIAVIGDGVFGKFLKREFDKHCPEQFTWDQTDANIYILAIPASAYSQVAQTYHDKHLVNVCSVQAKTNFQCARFSHKVTGIHPLFGPRTPINGRNAIVTLKCDESDFVIECFQKIMGTGKINEVLFGDGFEHDEIMSRTHLKVVKLQAQIQKIVKEAETIPDDLCPNSFIKLRAFAETFGDMPDGTLESILTNPFYGDI